MEYEIRKAKLEMAAEIKPISPDTKCGPPQASNPFHQSTQSKPATRLKRSPTIMDYPISTDSRPMPPRPVQNQHDQPSAAVTSVGPARVHLRQAQSRDALATLNRPSPLVKSNSSPEAGGERMFSYSPNSQTTDPVTASPERFQPAAPRNREPVCPPVSRPSDKRHHTAPTFTPATPLDPASKTSDRSEHRLRHSSSRIDTFRSHPQSLPKSSEKTSYDSGLVQTGNPPGLRWGQTSVQAALPARNQTCALPPAPPWENRPRRQSLPKPFGRETSDDPTTSQTGNYPRNVQVQAGPGRTQPSWEKESAPQEFYCPFAPRDASGDPSQPNLHATHNSNNGYTVHDNGQNLAPLPNYATRPSVPQGERVNPPHYQNVNPPCNSGAYQSNPQSDACPCRSMHALGVQAPCTNCRSAKQVQPSFFMSTPQSFPHAHPTCSQIPNPYPRPDFHQYDRRGSDSCAHQCPGSVHEPGRMIQVEVRVQYPPADRSRNGSY
ncbi:hypothetical protein B0H14DRAFT_1346949 [Mycena olivaceomarginata]|nr:hypothetical protein B0H14DRAFT_1346949 [Mycena olivaceomarginata]